MCVCVAGRDEGLVKGRTIDITDGLWARTLKMAKIVFLRK